VTDPQHDDIFEAGDPIRATPVPLAEAALLAPAVAPKSAEIVVAAVPEGTSQSGSVASLAAVQPTQVRRPWRTSFRTAFQALLALAVVWPVVINALGLPDWAWISVSLAVAAGITRVMALPQVEVFLKRFLPWLSAGGKG
jgi:hypothetical protein